MPASAQYHVILDGQGYMIDLASYHKRVADPFAPKRRAGDPGYGDLETASVWAQENWHQGFGTADPWMAKAPGYANGSYRLDSHFGDLRLGRNLLSVYNDITKLDIGALAVWKGALYAIRADGQ